MEVLVLQFQEDITEVSSQKQIVDAPALRFQEDLVKVSRSWTCPLCVVRKLLR